MKVDTYYMVTNKNIYFSTKYKHMYYYIAIACQTYNNIYNQKVNLQGFGTTENLYYYQNSMDRVLMSPTSVTLSSVFRSAIFLIELWYNDRKFILPSKLYG